MVHKILLPTFYRIPPALYGKHIMKITLNNYRNYNIVVCFYFEYGYSQLNTTIKTKNKIFYLVSTVNVVHIEFLNN